MTTDTAPSHPNTPVTADDIAAYRRDGVVCLRGLFEPVWVERLRAMVEHSMSTPGDQTRDYDTNAGGRFHANLFAWRHDPDIRDFVFESPAARIASALMGSTHVSFFFDHLLVKEPGTENPTPWHQDLPYWPVRGDQIVSLWFAMDRVDLTSGAVRYVVGSHRWTTWYRAQSFDGSDKYSDMSMPAPPDPDAHPETYPTVSFALEPGDVVAHHVMTMHGAPGNSSSDRRRRGLATRWCGDDAVFDPRPATMRLPFEPDLPPGAPMSSGLFPRVF